MEASDAAAASAVSVTGVGVAPAVAPGGAPVLTHRHVFGLKGDVPFGIYWSEDECVLYPAGHSLVLHSTDTRTQRFIHGSDVNGPTGRTEISAVCVSSNLRYIAMAERGTDQAYIHIYDARTLKKKKTLQTSGEMKSREVVSMCFSPDSKLLLTQGAAPEYKLINWQWAKGKVMHAQNMTGETADGTPQTVIQCSFCPNDPPLVCVSGRGLLAHYRLESVGGVPTMRRMELQLFGRPAEEEYLSHSWVGVDNGTGRGQASDPSSPTSRRMVVGTGDGQLLLIENGMLRCTLSTAMAQTDVHVTTAASASANSSPSVVAAPRLDPSSFTSPTSIDCIIPSNNSFFIGCDSGVVKQYVYNVDEDTFNLHRSWRVEENLMTTRSRVRGMAISPDEQHIVCYTEDCQAYILRQFNADPVAAANTSSTAGSSTDKDGSNTNADGTSGESTAPSGRFEPLSDSFHTGAVTGLDVCVRKPLAVSCGVDKTIRVWNYQTSKIELRAQFAETPLSVAFHPSGLHMAVGFSDKLRLMNLLLDDIRAYKEIMIKQCSELRFSHGGHLLAAMNGGLIQVYNTYTAELLWTFRGHTMPVRSLYFSLDDTRIVSCGLDGAVYERRISTGSGGSGAHVASTLSSSSTRTHELVQKGCKFSSALCTEDDKIYAVGDDRQLKEIVDKNISKTLDAGVVLTQIVVSQPPQRMMFAGTANGVIRSFQFPLTGVVKDYQAHCRSVTRLRMTPDDAFLLSAGEDGCLALLNVKEISGRLPKNERPDRVPFSEEVLVTKSDLEEKNALMAELRAKVDELTASNEYQLRLHDINHSEKLKEVAEKYALQLEHDAGRIDMMRDEKAELEMEMEDKLNALKLNHAQVLHLNDLEHQKAIMKQVARYQKLQAEAEQEVYEYEQLKQSKISQHRSEYQFLQQKYESILARELAEARAESLAKSSVSREYIETKEQLENDIDKEVEQLKEKFDAKLATERDATLRLKGENGIMRKKFKALQKDIDDQGENIRAMYEKEEQLLVHIRALEDRIAQHKHEIKERDKTIGANERTIYELKKDNQELEKFKFVLDYQIKELKRQIEPRENEIADMKETVRRMDKSLESVHKENGELKNGVQEMKDKLAMKQQAIRRQRQLYRQTCAELSALSNDISELVEFIQEPQLLKDAVQRVYQCHVTEKIHAAEVDPDVAKEYRRQKAYLEKSVDVLKKKLSRDIAARKNDNMRLMQENVALIKEINKLRREIKLMHQVQRQKELNTATRPHQAARDMEKEQWNEAERNKLIELQRTQINNLRMQIEEAQQRIKLARPTSATANMNRGALSDRQMNSSGNSSTMHSIDRTMPIQQLQQNFMQAH